MPADSAERERLRTIIDDKSLLKDGDFTLASGAKSNMFFDMKKTMLDPEGASLLTEALWEEIKDRDVDCIGGLEMGAVPIVSQLSMRSFPEKPIPSFFVRKQTKGHGTDQKIDGYLPKGKTAIVFEDVTTTGGSALQAVDAVRKAGLTVNTVITVVDRLAGAEQAFSEQDIELVSLFTKEDFQA
ncbi:MAG TPA: orotate phosphoribosyltransferase [Rhodospirillaceae bacterium]|nr:orotate phosphoribosyltransferase [Rhodospirillaceae bacterium]HAA92357.1 orotate phosphoribosyltransferase [Rhodospirillaceae bacterium]HAT35822.1 orotate phosphoribosyltransferase [Rhodospirillaceae bacterium]